VGPAPAAKQLGSSSASINVNERISIENNIIEAEAGRCATLRLNGTGSGSTVFDPEARLD
jgi:hypothetical protein